MTIKRMDHVGVVVEDLATSLPDTLDAKRGVSYDGRQS